MFNIQEFARASKAASRKVAQLSTNTKNQALQHMADQLLTDETRILAANAADLAAGREKGLSPAMLDRLLLNHDRLTKMADALREVAALPDPVGNLSEFRVRPNGIQVARMRIPLGVIAMIYESRPNVTADAAGLCLKAGNAVILRGGSEAFQSNQAIAVALSRALEQVQIPVSAISLLPTTDRAVLAELLKLDEQIDLVIPRGGEGLIRFVAENSRIPVIKHYKGVCHQFVDQDADIEMALRLLVDGKTSRPGVCNALETLLVHQAIAANFLPRAAAVMAQKGVELRGCAETRKILPQIAEATDDDFAAEYLALILAIKIVPDFDAALAHLARFSSDHTDVIVTNNLQTAQRFLREVNSAVVAVNASSRFSDGGELGLGAEIGISTTKLHAYGPMGLEALTTQKFTILGNGQVRHRESNAI